MTNQNEAVQAPALASAPTPGRASAPAPVPAPPIVRGQSMPQSNGVCCAVTNKNKAIKPSVSHQKQRRAGGFLRGLLCLLESQETEQDKRIISFEHGEGNVVVRDPVRLESEMLPRFFNQSTIASFFRQLNYFGFRKVSGKKRTNQGQRPEAILTLPRREGVRSRNMTTNAVTQQQQQPQLACNIVAALVNKPWSAVAPLTVQHPTQACYSPLMENGHLHVNSRTNDDVDTAHDISPSPVKRKRTLEEEFKCSNGSRGMWRGRSGDSDSSSYNVFRDINSQPLSVRWTTPECTRRVQRGASFSFTVHHEGRNNHNVVIPYGHDNGRAAWRATSSVTAVHPHGRSTNNVAASTSMLGHIGKDAGGYSDLMAPRPLRCTYVDALLDDPHYKGGLIYSGGGGDEGVSSKEMITPFSRRQLATGSKRVADFSPVYGDDGGGGVRSGGDEGGGGEDGRRNLDDYLGSLHEFRDGSNDERHATTTPTTSCSANTDGRNDPCNSYMCGHAKNHGKDNDEFGTQRATTAGCQDSNKEYGKVAATPLASPTLVASSFLRETVGCSPQPPPLKRGPVIFSGSERPQGITVGSQSVENRLQACDVAAVGNTHEESGSIFGDFCTAQGEDARGDDLDSLDQTFLEELVLSQSQHPAELPTCPGLDGGSGDSLITDSKQIFDMGNQEREKYYFGETYGDQQATADLANITLHHGGFTSSLSSISGGLLTVGTG